MLIPLRCACGRNLKLKEELAGKKIRCPECKAILTVPRSEREIDPDELVVEVLAADEPASEPSRQASVKEAIQTEVPEVRPAPRRRSDDAVTPRPRPRDDQPSKRRPKLRREDSRSGPLVAFEPGWFGSINSGVVGGLLMMLIAVVWFVLGLAAGRIFFYPPILFVIGIVSIVRGLSGN